MEKETLLIGEYTNDTELQRKNGEPILEWIQRTDSIMFARQVRESVQTGLKLTNHLCYVPNEAFDQVHSEISGLFEIN